MERSRHRNEALEKYKKEREDKNASYPERSQDKKRSHPDNDNPDKSKRVTIRDAIAEIDMFQTEHLKLREEVNLQKRLLGHLHKRLKMLEQKFENHVSMDGSSAPSAEVIGSALLSLSSTPSLKDDIEEVEKMCLACNKAVSLCKCFDD